ncbi:MAG: hypothetical protein ACHQXL_04020 [Candidatus Limnocylindrales bacterium]
MHAQPWRQLAADLFALGVRFVSRVRRKLSVIRVDPDPWDAKVAPDFFLSTTRIGKQEEGARPTSRLPSPDQIRA